jgi:subtilisin family serine protease/subtilisin-like proprotein convertase family protein
MARFTSSKPSLNTSFRKRLNLEFLEERTVLNAAMGPFASSSNLLVDPTTYMSNTILVQFKPDAVLSGDIDLHGAKITQSLELVDGLYELQLAQGMSVEGALAVFQADTRVATAEANYRLMLENIPNDPRFSSMYGLNNTAQTGGIQDADIDAPEAWNINTGTRRTIVAVIDTGVDYNHQDLAANMWRNAGEIAGDGIDNDGNGYADDIYGYDFANNDADPFDDQGHGTHVAGTIGAVGNNGIGITGVNWNTQIMALKFLGADGSGSTAGAISALNYAVRMDANLSNNSWGGGGSSSLLSQAINNARTAGHIFVAAAGNSGQNNDLTPNYPSNYNFDNVVAVAATDNKDVLASFSSYGATTVDIAAPGVGILSTLPNNSYGSYSGTSMATPHVSGAIALIWDQNPTFTYQQVIAKLYSSVDKIAGLNGKVATGGRLNIGNALNGNTTNPPPADLAGAKILTSEAIGINSGAITGFKVKFSEAIQVSTLTAASIKVNSPSGSLLTVSGITAVAGSNNTEFTFNIARSSNSGIYTIKVGPNVLDLTGNKMNQDGDTINGELTQDVYSASFTQTSSTTFNFYNTTSSAIRDFTKTVSYITINQDITITDLNVAINVTHTYDSDLIISLKSPTGVVSTLSYRRGGSGDNFASTIFDDEATKAISSGIAPFKGSFKPETLLSAFDGLNSRGVWTLTVEDKATYDTGSLKNWAISLTGANRLATTVRKFDGEATPVADAPAAEPIALPSKGLDCPQSGIESPAPSANLQAPANNLTSGSVASYLVGSPLTSNSNSSNATESESSRNEESNLDYTSNSSSLSDYFFAANSSTVSFYGIDTYESEEESESEVNIHDAIFMV